MSEETKVLPEGWKWVKLEELTEGEVFCDGDWVESKDQDSNGEVRLIQLADIGDGIFKDKSNRHLTSAKAKKLNCTFLKKEDILIARMPDPLGRACIFPLKGEFKYVTVVDVCILRVNRGKVKSKFLLSAINSPQLRNEIDKLKSGTTRKRISRKNLATINFPLPPLPTQEAIVAKIETLFSELDNGIAQLKKAQQQLYTYRQSVLKWAFEGKLTNKHLKDGELPKGWEWVKLGDVLDVLTDYHANGSYMKLKENVVLSDGDGYAIMIRATNFEKNDFVERLKYISKSAYDFLEKSKLFGGEILIGKIGNAGKVYLMPKLNYPCSLAMNLFLLRFIDKMNNKYAYYQLISASGTVELQSRVKGVGSPTIDKKSVRSVPLKICSLEEQECVIQEIERRLSVADKLQETITTSLAQAESLRQSILKQAFEGRLV